MGVSLFSTQQAPDVTVALSAATTFDLALPANAGIWECTFVGTITLDAAFNLRMNAAAMDVEAFFGLTQAGATAGAAGNSANARDGHVTLTIRTGRAAASNAKVAYVTCASGDAASSIATFGFGAEADTTVLSSIGLSVAVGSMTGTFSAWKKVGS